MCGGRLSGPSSKGGKKPALTLNSTRYCVTLHGASSLQPLPSPLFTTLCLQCVAAGLYDAAEDELHFWLPFYPPCLALTALNQFCIDQSCIQHC